MCDCGRWINSKLLTTSYALSVTIVVGVQNIASRREAGRLAILKYVTHVAVSECTLSAVSVLRNSASNKNKKL